MTAFYSVDKWTRIDPATKTNLRFALYHKSFVERKQSARAAGCGLKINDDSFLS